MLTHNEAESPSEGTYTKIDHIAIAVKELDPAVTFFSEVLGFTLIRRLSVVGQRTGMISAEMQHNGIKFVLCQGTEPASQISQLISNYGPGVAHIALAVDDVDDVARDLSRRGMQFDTTVINGSGLKQIFSSRDSNIGLSFELIERQGEDGFLEENIQELFDQLERSGAY